MCKKYIGLRLKEMCGCFILPVVLTVLVLMLCILFERFVLWLGFETQMLSVGVTFALLVITFLYTQATVGIVTEAKKDRQIRFIEKRLENFYYPLKLRLIYFERDDDKPLDDFAFELMDSFSKYIYLASDEFASIWEGFVEQFDMDLYPNIEKQIEEDIKKYERELKDLR